VALLQRPGKACELPHDGLEAQFLDRNDKTASRQQYSEALISAVILVEGVGPGQGEGLRKLSFEE
jgi:hypothetical protein